MDDLDIIKIISFLISIAAFIISFTNFKTEKISSIYEKLFNNILLSDLPENFNNLILDIDNRVLQEKFVRTIHELINKIYFFQLYNIYIYRDLKKLLLEIDDNFEFYCQSKNSKYISKISNDIRKLYDIIYNLNLFKVIKYSIRRRLENSKFKV